MNITKELIDQDKIEPYLQPIVDFQTGETVKYEVLARGDYNGKVLLPFQFIEPAERLGLISSITRMMVNKCFSYFSGSDYKFSINITQRDLLDQYIISFLHNKIYNQSISWRFYEKKISKTLCGHVRLCPHRLFYVGAGGPHPGG